MGGILEYGVPDVEYHARPGRAAPTDDEALDRRTEARQTECGCRACDPGWWADEETETDG